jgi:hypothetical protein
LNNGERNIIRYVPTAPWDIYHQLLKLSELRLRLNKWYHYWGQVTIVKFHFWINCTFDGLFNQATIAHFVEIEEAIASSAHSFNELFGQKGSLLTDHYVT